MWFMKTAEPTTALLFVKVMLTCRLGEHKYGINSTLEPLVCAHHTTYIFPIIWRSLLVFVQKWAERVKS